MAHTILETRPLGFPWVTFDPFLFCVHHDDAYPAGNDHLGPAASLDGRDIGQDFEGLDGWRMYHGELVPGFPQHPHRGFETVTVVRKGLIDHADSMGAQARYGGGDVQWLTAGAGISHSEMFPLVARDQPNPAELFQIWLNLAAADKKAAPHFAMLWNESIPRVVVDEGGRKATITVIAGALQGAAPQPPPPRSWAARADSDVAIWTVHLEEGARFTLPPARDPRTGRTLYFFRGDGLRIDDTNVKSKVAIRLRSDAATELTATHGDVELLMLQGRPIGEPVASYGPFVMNNPAEIRQAFVDYERTRFGGWPWADAAPVHGRDEGRFAKRPDGSIERPPR